MLAGNRIASQVGLEVGFGALNSGDDGTDATLFQIGLTTIDDVVGVDRGEPPVFEAGHTVIPQSSQRPDPAR